MLRLHIIKRRNGWAVVREGAKRAYLIKPTVKESIKSAKDGFKQYPKKLITHSSDGTVESVEFINDRGE